MASSHTRTSGRARRGTNSASLFSRTNRRDALGAAGRAGFVARGVVYVLVGVLAVAVAFGKSSNQADQQGALHQIAVEPFGLVLLWVLAAGFACMALWWAYPAVRGEPGRRESGGKEAGHRVVNAARAVFYAAICWGTAAYAAGRSGGSNSDTESQDWTASALKLPGGRLLVGAAGLVLAGVGIGVCVWAFQQRFLKQLDTAAMSARTRKVVTALGVAGNAARGTVFIGAGAFVLIAAINFDPHQAKGTDATLRSFAHTPAGPWLLVLVAVGLVLFGGFCFASARWRRF